MKRKIIGWSLLGIVVLLGLFWGLTATNIITLDIKREVRQHSQQYVETKVALLHDLYNDYLDLESDIELLNLQESTDKLIEAKEAQQKQLVKQMAEEVGMIPVSEVPREINILIERKR